VSEPTSWTRFHWPANPARPDHSPCERARSDSARRFKALDLLRAHGYELTRRLALEIITCSRRDRRGDALALATTRDDGTCANAQRLSSDLGFIDRQRPRGVLACRADPLAPACSVGRSVGVALRRRIEVVVLVGVDSSGLADIVGGGSYARAWRTSVQGGHEREVGTSHAAHWWAGARRTAGFYSATAFFPPQ